ncbi:RNA polymerase sigma-70 factor, ECF subfamily [Nannocystis exedens]|uniref:RNA polymerase sigma factor n=1 Tax=Nannocystis exedens TaxID=54 RepID=A0A1I2F623_9BACT|nr:sigma-70 family RNA polymerase sigma factor [Nannocystis exedens]PCC73088.1 DNA-directed RNA polymerase sigma-70 factor [Nannocystis exedens]SFF00419.1 RNA polymerase sigma-70 factor, ECF subfamily [Nannocystis exedens]
MTEPDRDLAPETPAAAARLVANHRRFLAFLQARVGSRALAEDILQDAFVRGLGKLDGLRDEESAIAWFYRVLRNAVIDHQRRDAAASRRLDALAAELDPIAPASETHGAVCQCVGQLADNLKPEYAEALRRIELDGVAVKDYAAEAGITAGNAAVRVFRAREALRRQVMRSCGTCAEHGCLDCTCAGPCGDAPKRA